MVQNGEFIDEFIAESKNHLQTMEAVLGEQQDGADSHALNAAFRAAHSTKAAAEFFGLRQIAILSHSLEKVFYAMWTNAIHHMTEEQSRLLESSCQQLYKMIADVDQSEHDDISDVVQQLEGLVSETSTAETLTLRRHGEESFNVESKMSDLIKEGIVHGNKLYEIRLKLNQDLLTYPDGPMQLFKRIQAAGMLVETVTDHSEIQDLDQLFNDESDAIPDVHLGILVTSVYGQDEFATAIGLKPDCISELNVAGLEEKKKALDIAMPLRLDDAASVQPPKAKKTGITFSQPQYQELRNIAGELALARNQLLSMFDPQSKQRPALGTVVQNIDELTNTIREKIAQPGKRTVSGVFSDLPQLVEQWSESNGKQVQLRLEGGDVYLDEVIAAELKDPLVALPQTAIQYGLERPKARKLVGKPQAATIVLRAYYSGEEVVIEVADDGKGINVEKVRSCAVETDHINLEEIDLFDQQELLQLVFNPCYSSAGFFSPSAQVETGFSEVKQTIERLGGMIELHSAMHKGTTARLVFPRRAPSITGRVVQIQDQSFVLPASSIDELITLSAEGENTQIETINDVPMLRQSGRLLPIVMLAPLLGSSQEDIERVVVLRQGNRTFGLAVDRVLKQDEVIVKPLPRFFQNCHIYAGVAVADKGTLIPILDAAGIVRVSNIAGLEEDVLGPGPTALTGAMTSETQNLLLFQCSGAETYAVDLALIDRVEEIRRREIEITSGQEFINSEGKRLQVIRPERFIQGGTKRRDGENLYVLIPKYVCHPVGIVIQEIVDTVNLALKLATDSGTTAGLVGRAEYNGTTLLVLNVFELLELAVPELCAPRSRNRSEGKRILLVEDTEFFQIVTARYLETAGYGVQIASNGQEALERLAAEKFDAVISDIQMPIMDGLELIKQIRQQEQFKSLPVLGLTSASSEKWRQEGMESGFDFYEFKLDRDRLLATVEKALAQGRGQK